MNNKYLIKVAEDIDKLKLDMMKPWTVWGQQEVMRDHGYDVSKGQLMELNGQTQGSDPLGGLKRMGIGAVAGAGIGGLIGAIVGKNLESAGAGSALGGMAGMLGGQIQHGHHLGTTVYPELIRQKIESGAFKRIGE